MMRWREAFVLCESGAEPHGLLAAVSGAGLRARCLRPAEAVRAAAGRGPVALLAPASLGPARVHGLVAALREHGTDCAALVYPDRGSAALEDCARSGIDYVAPPFLASLLRLRLEAQSPAAETARELEQAERIQAGFLPAAAPELPGWQAAARLRAARGVSGDFYDWLPAANRRRTGFLVADVCDKGYGAGLLMAALRTLMRHEAGGAAGGDTAPLRAIRSANDLLAREHLGEGWFATVFYGQLDLGSGALRYVNAGHHGPLVLRRDGGREPLRPTGPAVGMFADAEFAVGIARIAVGDTLLAYTDGAVEARSGHGAPYGLERLAALVERSAALDADMTLDAVEHDLARHAAGGPGRDDTTLLLLRRLPTPPAD